MTHLRLLLLVFSTSLLGPDHFWAQTTTTINYGASAADFPNPERGFYRYSEGRASNYSTLDTALVASYRNLHQPAPGANYSVYSTLVFRYFILDNFKTSNISQSFLDSMAVDFAAARTAGVKLILRFAYTTMPVGGSCQAGWVCPPYGDAEKSWILTHIGQVQPILEANKDVIAVVQMGFIGIWGENYYTDYFGDASINGQGYLSSQNWTDRKDVLEALLDAVPAARMVQVRYPQLKQKMIYGNAAPTTSLPIVPAQAHNGSAIARIGHHNDCLLASPDDFGTYFSYDNVPFSDTTNLKPYKAAEGNFVAVGGETCSDSYDPYNNCVANGGGAFGDTEIRRMHYSYLNAEYDTLVNNDWTGTCMEDIKKKLGYRFALQSGNYSDEAQPGQTISVTISLKNEGFAAPFNPRGVELVLRNTTTNLKWYAPLQGDPRFWLGHGAEHTVGQELCIPEYMPAGTYDLLLNLPDPMASIYARPEYAIRLANSLPGGADVWEDSTGYNRLGHSIFIGPTSAGQACNGETGFGLNPTFLSSCSPNLAISGMVIPTGEYRSTGGLVADNSTVTTGSIVLFWGETDVVLDSGFTVETGGYFQAGVQACPANFAVVPAQKE